MAQGLVPVLSLTTMEGTQGLLAPVLPAFSIVHSLIPERAAGTAVHNTEDPESKPSPGHSYRHRQRLALGTGHGWQERKEGMGPRSPHGECAPAS